MDILLSVETVGSLNDLTALCRLYDKVESNVRIREATRGESRLVWDSPHIGTDKEVAKWASSSNEP